jgi:hypothetical protein
MRGVGPGTVGVLAGRRGKPRRAGFRSVRRSWRSFPLVMSESKNPAPAGATTSLGLHSCPPRPPAAPGVTMASKPENCHFPKFAPAGHRRGVIPEGNGVPGRPYVGPGHFRADVQVLGGAGNGRGASCSQEKAASNGYGSRRPGVRGSPVRAVGGVCRHGAVDQPSRWCSDVS